MIIYKYLNPTAALETIRNNSVLLRMPEEFNDPFDCLFYVSKKEMKRAYKLFINYQCFKVLHSEFIVQEKTPMRLKGYASILIGNVRLLAPRVIKNSRYSYQPDIAAHYRFAKAALKRDDSELQKEFNQMIKKVMKDIRRLTLVSCFSTSNDSILMWSHYAKDHTGACVEFEINDKSFKAVKYCKRMKSFRLTRVLEYVFGNDFSGTKMNYEDDSFLFVVEPILTKADMWRYEHEIRCVFSNNNRDKRIFDGKDGKMLLKMPKIRRIIVGCNADDEFIDEIKELPDIGPIYKMKMIDGQYKIVEDLFNEKI